MTEKIYKITITKSVYTQNYKLKIIDPQNDIVVSVHFGDSFKGLNNYLYRFLERKEEEGF